LRGVNPRVFSQCFWSKPWGNSDAGFEKPLTKAERGSVEQEAGPTAGFEGRDIGTKLAAAKTGIMSDFG